MPAKKSSPRAARSASKRAVGSLNPRGAGRQSTKAVGLREQAVVVRRYLEVLEQRPKVGSNSSAPEVIERRIAHVRDQIATAGTLRKLDLVVNRQRLEKLLAAQEAGRGYDRLEAAFVKVAKDYSDRKQIHRAAWREMGVPLSVLKKAGI